MNILLTGSHGYIASNLNRYLSKEYNFTLINRSVFDLIDSYATKKWFDTIDIDYFDVVIHTAIKGGNRLENDTSLILDNNLKMYLNLLENKHRYKKFINIGSGVETGMTNSFYGLSKKAIALSLSDKDNYYNLKIYGVFDEYELDRRFIKNNLKRYICKENLTIYQNKYMDFIYFQDFISIIKLYLHNENMPKFIDCVYKEKYNLIQIANIINHLDSHQININMENEANDKDYIGQYTDLGLSYIGLQRGIENTYRNLKNEKSLVCSK